MQIYKVTILSKNYKNVFYNESLCYSIRFQEAETSWELCILNVLISFIVFLLNSIQRQSNASIVVTKEPNSSMPRSLPKEAKAQSEKTLDKWYPTMTPISFVISIQNQNLMKGLTNGLNCVRLQVLINLHRSCHAFWKMEKHWICKYKE